MPEETNTVPRPSAGEMSVSQKLTAVILDLKKIYPLLFAAVTVIPRIESGEISSFAVSPDTLYYNSRFVLETPREELLFFLIHSIYHILMQHHIRGEGKKPRIWNEACDLFINKCIFDTFGIKPGGGSVLIRDEAGRSTALSMPENEYFDEEIDPKTDTPEAIYRELVKESDKSTTGSNEGFGDSGKKGEMEKSPVHDSEEAGGVPGETDKESTRGENTEPFLKDAEMQTEESDTSTVQSHTSENIVRMDIINDEKSRLDSSATRVQRSQRLLSKINTINRQMQEMKYSRGASQDPVMEAEMHKKVSRVNWRVLVQNHLIRMISDEKSLSTPDRRFVHHGLYIEGPVQEENLLQDIRICIDTSASMSDRDIKDAMFQIECLMRQYNIQAELVFWDETIEARFPFTTSHEFKLAGRSALGRGGTNPDCLFEAFAQSNTRGHASPVPELLLIFTDGYFEPPGKEYRKAFHDKTIWILCSEDAESIEKFKPGFGKTIQLEIS